MPVKSFSGDFKLEFKPQYLACEFNIQMADAKTTFQWKENIQ